MAKFGPHSLFLVATVFVGMTMVLLTFGGKFQAVLVASFLFYSLSRAGIFPAMFAQVQVWTTRHFGTSTGGVMFMGTTFNFLVFPLLQLQAALDSWLVPNLLVIAAAAVGLVCALGLFVLESKRLAPLAAKTP